MGCRYHTPVSGNENSIRPGFFGTIPQFFIEFFAGDQERPHELRTDGDKKDTVGQCRRNLPDLAHSGRDISRIEIRPHIFSRRKVVPDIVVTDAAAKYRNQYGS